MEKYLIKTKCVHHWIIESPDGLTSTGVCKNCGAKKSFVNVIGIDTLKNPYRDAKGRRYTEMSTEMLRGCCVKDGLNY